MSWNIERIGSLLTESRIPALLPNPDKRIRVKLNVAGVEKRPIENEIAGATKQFIRKTGQFIYGRQNFHKGAFGIVPSELGGFETSADIPSFDVRKDCLPEWIYYFFKIGDRYLELEKLARGIGSKRIHPEQIYHIEIPLPSIEEQREFISRFIHFEKSSSEFQTEQLFQLDLLKKLRNQILQDAIQGKLVTQDANVEPASKLLERIKAEKEQLISEKKIKKDKPLPEIKSEEIPFEIPNNWVWCRLGEFAYITSGSTPKQDAFVKDGIPYLKMYNLKYQKIDFNYKPQYITEKIHNGQLKRSRTQVGDLLMNIVGPPLGKLAIIPESLPHANFNQAAVLIRPYLFKEINRWVFWYLNEMSEIKSIATKGVAGQDNISVTQSNLMKIPLPPFAEQESIITKIEQLMKLSDELELSIKQNQKYTQELLKMALKEALEPKK